MKVNLKNRILLAKDRIKDELESITMDLEEKLSLPEDSEETLKKLNAYITDEDEEILQNINCFHWD